MSNSAVPDVSMSPVVKSMTIGVPDTSTVRLVSANLSIQLIGSSRPLGP